MGALDQPDLLAAGEKAPSLVNGGLDKVNPLFFMGIIIFSATVEATALKLTRTPDFIQGDLELKELNNGRLAMLAITYYALEEFLTKASVTENTPFLFKSVFQRG